MVASNQEKCERNHHSIEYANRHKFSFVNVELNILKLVVLSLFCVWSVAIETRSCSSFQFCSCSSLFAWARMHVLQPTWSSSIASLVSHIELVAATRQNSNVLFYVFIQTIENTFFMFFFVSFASFDKTFHSIHWWSRRQIYACKNIRYSLDNLAQTLSHGTDLIICTDGWFNVTDCRNRNYRQFIMDTADVQFFDFISFIIFRKTQLIEAYNLQQCQYFTTHRRSYVESGKIFMKRWRNQLTSKKKRKEKTFTIHRVSNHLSNLKMCSVFFFFILLDENKNSNKMFDLLTRYGRYSVKRSLNHTEHEWQR